MKVFYEPFVIVPKICMHVKTHTYTHTREPCRPKLGRFVDYQATLANEEVRIN